MYKNRYIKQIVQNAHVETKKQGKTRKSLALFDYSIAWQDRLRSAVPTTNIVLPAR